MYLELLAARALEPGRAQAQAGAALWARYGHAMGALWARYGRAMRVHVIQRSTAAGFGDRGGLHSLEDPHTHTAYRRYGMTEYGRGLW